jgi:hypothetical protein
MKESVMTLKRWWVAVLVAGLSACATMSDAVSQLPWRDLWGDRGHGVLARDHQWCEAAVESRRSLMAACMTQRGWSIAP